MRWQSRTLALGALGAAAVAAFAAISTALDAPQTRIAEAKAAEATMTSRTVSFPGGRVVQRVRPSGLACFTVGVGTSTVARSCYRGLASDEMVYASSRHAVGGFAGAAVRGVIVKLTKKGTVWATVRRGAFYEKVPTGHRVRALVKVVRGGSRTTFTVTG